MSCPDCRALAMVRSLRSFAGWRWNRSATSCRFATHEQVTVVEVPAALKCELAA